MSKVDDALVEIIEELTTFAPEFEGLQDFNRLNLTAHTKEGVQAAINKYQQRINLLLNAKAHLEALIGDGHPGILIMEIDLSSLQDLMRNAGTIEAALAKFNSNAATGLSLEAGAPQPK